MAALSNSGLESATYFSDTIPALSSDNFMTMDYSLVSFSVHGILQAKTLEWVSISFSHA